MVYAGDGRHPRSDTGGQHHVVESGEVARRRPQAEPHGHPMLVQHGREVADGFAELLLAGDALGHIELAADEVVGIEQGHAVTPLRCADSSCQSGRSRADHRD